MDYLLQDASTSLSRDPVQVWGEFLAGTQREEQVVVCQLQQGFEDELALDAMLFFHSQSIQWRLFYGNKILTRMKPYQWELLNQTLRREAQTELADVPIRFFGYSFPP